MFTSVRVIIGFRFTVIIDSLLSFEKQSLTVHCKPMFTGLGYRIQLPIRCSGHITRHPSAENQFVEHHTMVH